MSLGVGSTGFYEIFDLMGVNYPNQFYDMPIAAAALILAIICIIGGWIKPASICVLHKPLIVAVCLLTALMIYQGVVQSVVWEIAYKPPIHEILLPLQLLIAAMLLNEKRSFVAAGCGIFSILFIVIIITLISEGGLAPEDIYESSVITSFTLSRLALLAAVFLLIMSRYIEQKGLWRFLLNGLACLSVWLTVSSASRIIFISLCLTIAFIVIFAVARSEWREVRNAVGWVVLGIFLAFVTSDRVQIRVLNYNKFVQAKFPQQNIETIAWSGALEDKSSCLKAIWNVEEQYDIKTSEVSKRIACENQVTITDWDHRLRLWRYAITGATVWGSEGNVFRIIIHDSYGKEAIYEHPHNIFLEAWFAAGIIGVLIVMALATLIVMETAKLLVNGEIRIMLATTIPVVFLLSAMVSGDIYDARWAVIGICIGSVFGAERNCKSYNKKYVE